MGSDFLTWLVLRSHLLKKRVEYRDEMDSTLKVPVSRFVTLKCNWVSLINYADSRL